MSQKNSHKIIKTSNHCKTHLQAWHPEHTGQAGWVSGSLLGWDTMASVFFLHPSLCVNETFLQARVRSSSDRKTLLAALSFATQTSFSLWFSCLGASTNTGQCREEAHMYLEVRHEIGTPMLLLRKDQVSLWKTTKLQLRPNYSARVYFREVGVYPLALPDGSSLASWYVFG